MLFFNFAYSTYVRAVLLLTVMVSGICFPGIYSPHRLEFMADMKLGHYLHIAPRTVFLTQGLATLIGAVVQCGVTVFMITRIDGVPPSSPS